MIIKETGSYLLEYLEEHETMIHTLKRNNSKEEWQDLLTTGTEFLQEKGLSKWISENKRNGRISEEGAVWINDLWLPRAIQAGWRTWAIVEPENFTSRLNQRKYKSSFLEMGITVSCFSRLTEAIKWIDEQ